MTDSIKMTCFLDEIGANDLEKWLDSSPPLSDDEMKAMSAYFQSESFQYPESNLCDLTSIDKYK